MTCPGAELVHRFADLVPDPDTLVVVSCAGRTRSIIGAQSLINAGVPNKVVSLQGGTQGWRLAGLELERGRRRVAPVSAEAAAAARQRAAAVAARFGVRRIDRATLAAWQAEDDRRTTYLLDVRTPEEFAAGHLPGSVSAQGGQLVQAIDRWVGTRGARLVLVDDSGTRAIMSAHWLMQMGWDVRCSTARSMAWRSRPGRPSRVSPRPCRRSTGRGGAASRRGRRGICLGPSAAYRQAHPEERYGRSGRGSTAFPRRALRATGIVVFSADDAAVAAGRPRSRRARRGAVVLVPAASRRGARRASLRRLAGRSARCRAHRLCLLEPRPPRRQREAMRAYLRWETELPAEIAPDGLAGFKLGPPLRPARRRVESRSLAREPVTTSTPSISILPRFIWPASGSAGG